MTGKFEITGIKTISSSGELIVVKEGQKVEVTEFSAQSLTCPLPKKSLFVGNLVTLTSLMELHGKNVRFEATGVISAVEDIPSTELARVQIQMRQFNKKTWSLFLTVWQEKQDKADALFAAIKGESR